jgi:hypothetical protein
MTAEKDSARSTAAELTTFANDVHGYLRQNITWADQKAAFLFAGASGFLAYLNSHGAFGFLHGNVAFRRADILLILAAASLLVTAAAAFITYWPRTKGLHAGLVFWGAIARNESAGAYLERVRGKAAEELAAAKLEHSYELAKICERKFKWADIGVRFGVVGFSLAIFYSLCWL